ncbi:TPA: Rrf2 family transcriptional regulator [bacterium]|jgi:Rrf2 family protein|nr:Rrf2 family transcriptional regulator [bacterium]
MSNILKISEAASLALHVAVILAAKSNELVATKDFASMLQASEAHLSKVLQRLEKAGIVNSTRGPKGGFKLSKPSNEITLLAVYQAIDGELSTSNCLLNKDLCNGNCIMGDLVEKLNKQVKDYLSNTKLDSLTSAIRSIKNYA